MDERIAKLLEAQNKLLAAIATEISYTGHSGEYYTSYSTNENGTAVYRRNMPDTRETEL
jgi:hypothetical protein